MNHKIKNRKIPFAVLSIVFARNFLPVKSLLIRLFIIHCLFFIIHSSLFISSVSAQEQKLQERYTYTRRNDSKEGDYKVVVVPVTNKRRAMLDAQTYHVGWDAVDAWMGQSRVMYCVLLKKRPPYIPGQPPVTRRIPKERL